MIKKISINRSSSDTNNKEQGFFDMTFKARKGSYYEA